MAGSKNHLAGRLRILPQRTDELVRKQARGLRVWAGAQSAIARDHRTADVGSNRAVEPNRQAGASVHRVHLSDSKNEETRLGSRAPRGGQSRAYRWQREPAFCRDIAESRTMGAQALYEELYCARGDMENRIKRAVQFICRSGQRRDDAGQSTTSVIFGRGLCAGERLAAARIKSNRVCAGTNI